MSATTWATDESPLAADAVGLRPETLLDGVLAMLVLAVVQRGVGFVRAILFCRWLDPDQLGLWDMAWGFMILAAPLAVLSLPGAFGRYSEHFRQQGMLRPFLRRTALFCAAAGGVSLTILVAARAPLSSLFFGDAGYSRLMLVAAGAMAAMIAYNYLTNLYIALRRARIVAVFDFINSIAFAAIGVGLLAAGYAAAESLVAAWGCACALCAVIALVCLRPVWAAMPEPAGHCDRGAVFRKLAPFALWVLLIDLLNNVFMLIDRAMIVHFAPGDALATLGQYHSSRVVPMLLVTIAGLLGTIALPHLSHDWEAGRRQRVAQRLRLFLKLAAFGLTAAATGILMLAPWLFSTALGGKYADGLAVLPWTLVLCVWLALTLIAQQYLWCAEKAGYVCAVLVAGLALNVTLNVALLPRLGLLGAVLSTATANATTLVLVVALSRRAGFTVDRGLVVLLALPVTLALGWLATAALLLLLGLAAWRGEGIFSPAEREQLAERGGASLERLRAWRLRRVSTG